MASITAYTTTSSVVCAALMPKASIVRPDSALGKADFKFPPRINKRNLQGMGSRVCCFLGVSPPSIDLQPLMSDNPFCGQKVINTISSKNAEMQNTTEALTKSLVIIDLDPATAKVAIAILGPFLSAFSFLFILRIIMSWYPKLPVEKFPYFIAYAPTEPLLIPTRRLIPPLGGVDVTPVVWFGLISFLNEILVGPQGLLVLLSQQIS
ncbi:protein COFACTOR ASSEMBLY OF COMPLEX C SUBUNIT B CCB3, chloroplastic isoform X1 [Coffea eugenioides]|uniref:protein COFACTOR ASSEMBLY OF COMPLEX C SUBUNIT B CCB3, chloroplastic isoform X1 n=1 Tax=Coffea eugenioides TaxID=49369 RepID=UPI000F6067D2|nr:protein COFACTOR ASSEMBLY OF COMPLEX C SUBUNIT B CCB3, chloroplastic isoform X1 [Coffea eugenioides]